ncbi:MAG: YkvA family protein [Chloroflexota bacterium]
MFRRLKEWKETAKRNTTVSYLAVRDPRTPWRIKAIAAAMALYVISPIDAIPDFIPFHGVVDDLLVIPLAIAMMVHLIPTQLRDELEERAEIRMATKSLGRRIAEVVIIVCLVGIAAVIAWLIWFR